MQERTQGKKYNEWKAKFDERMRQHQMSIVKGKEGIPPEMLPYLQVLAAYDLLAEYARYRKGRNKLFTKFSRFLHGSNKTHGDEVRQCLIRLDGWLEQYEVSSKKEDYNPQVLIGYLAQNVGEVKNKSGDLASIVKVIGDLCQEKPNAYAFLMGENEPEGSLKSGPGN